MNFLPTDEQTAFADAVDEIVEAAGGADVAQAWASGDTGPALALWAQFGDLGLSGLRIAEDDGGLGGSVVDLVIVAERLGYHGVPGPYIESLALLPHLVDDEARAALAAGSRATAAVAGVQPLALHAATAELVFDVDSHTIAPATAGEAISSMAGTRSLSPVTRSGDAREIDPAVLARAVDEATLAAAAMLVGMGERLLDDAVEYAKIREQFGRPIGEYQALKHQLADVRVALSFARPLAHNAALTIDSADGARDVSAAKVAAGDAAALAARTCLQVHGAIGYTGEHHVGQWTTAVPALAASWGSASHHRARIADAILDGGAR